MVKGDGDLIWAKVLADMRGRQPSASTKAGAVDGDQFVPARWDLLPATDTCGLRCRRCAAAPSIARSARCGAPTGSNRGSAASDAVVGEIVEFRRLGFRFIALADDNFYPVTLTDLELAERAGQPGPAAGAARRSAPSGSR